MTSPWDKMPPGLKTYYEAIANHYIKMRDELYLLRDELEKSLDPCFVKRETDRLRRDMKALTKKMELVDRKLNYIINNQYLPSGKIRPQTDLMKQEINPENHSSRLTNCLLNSPYKTYGEIFTAGSRDIIRLRNLGKKHLNELREFFHIRGYVLL